MLHCSVNCYRRCREAGLRLAHGGDFWIVKFSAPDWSHDAKQGGAVIVLHGTEPAFGLPQASPFAMKVEVLLKLSGLPYALVQADMRGAPRGKIPWIVDEGRVISDSRLIQAYLETNYTIDFTHDYSGRALAYGLAIERMLEDHLYPILIEQRWASVEDLSLDTSQGFDRAPAMQRLWLQIRAGWRARRLIGLLGLDRLTSAEKYALVCKALDALETAITGQLYMLGGRVCGVDATAYAFLAALAAPQFRSSYGAYLRKQVELSAYLARMQAEFYPDFAG